MAFAGAALETAGAVEKVIVQTEFAIVLLRKLLFSLLKFPLEKQSIFLKAEKEVFHPLDPGRVDLLTDGFAH